MRGCSWIKETRRELIREKRREIRQARNVAKALHLGCSLTGLFDGSGDFRKAVYQMDAALDEMDRITKPLR